MHTTLSIPSFPKGTSLRILSYNIHQGLTLHRKKSSLYELGQLLKTLKVDILLLQEVAGRVENSKKIPPHLSSIQFQLDAISELHWPYAAYGKNVHFKGGYYGNAILSKYPIKETMNIDISLKNLIRRGMLISRIELGPSTINPTKSATPLAEVYVVATHFGLLDREREKQLSKLLHHLPKHIPKDAPLILGGDFNDWREKLTLPLRTKLKVHEAYYEKHKRHARTFPSTFPVLRLDRIYFRGLELVHVKTFRGAPWYLLSDHLPVLAEFKLR